MKVRSFLLGLCLLFCSLESRAELASLFGLGPISSAMGGTSLQQGRPNVFQVYNAPAALGFLKRPEVTVGMLYLEPDLKPFGTVVIDSSGTLGEFRSAGVLPGGGQLFGLALPFGKQRPLTIAGSIYLPFSTLLRVSGSPVNFPFYPLYTDISRNFFFVIGAGIEPIDGWAIGINFRSTTKSVTYYVLNSSSSVNYSASATEAKSETRLSYSLIYDNEKRNPDLPFSLGLMYRAKSGIQTKVSADITAFANVQGSIISSPTFTPSEWVLMASGKLSESLTVSADAAWVEWRKYPAPYGSGNINTYVFSAERGAGFRDILVSRFGADYHIRHEGNWLKTSSYRMGYINHPTPVPDQRLDSNYVDNKRHNFSVGGGIGLANPWEEDSLIDLDAFFQYNWLVSRKVTKEQASNIGAPGYSTGGKILLYGLGATFRF